MLEDLLFENLPFTNLQKNGIHGALCFVRVYGDFCLVIYCCNIAFGERLLFAQKITPILRISAIHPHYRLGNHLCELFRCDRFV